MSELLVTHFDVATGNCEIRPMNEQELQQLNNDIALKNEKMAIETEIENNKKILLEKLGITADEAKLLLQ
jgi:AmiR/NasT family two-component response regulator